MSRRSHICAIPNNWTIEDYFRSTCGGGSHIHLSPAEVRDKEKRSLIAWRLRDGKKQVVTVLPERIGPEPGSSNGGMAFNIGLSNRVGEELALAVYRGEGWARVMVGEMKPATRRGRSA